MEQEGTAATGVTGGPTAQSLRSGGANGGGMAPDGDADGTTDADDDAGTAEATDADDLVGALRPTDHGAEFEATVLRSRPETPTTHSIRVARHPDFDFEPVQFTYLSLRTDEADDYSDYRPMSLASPPTRDYLEYGVRLSDSAWKRAFAALDPGDRVLVEGPRGHFVLREDRAAVLVAGGIGITPLKGMAQYVADEGLDLPVVLLYSNRTPDEIAFRDEVDALARDHAHIEVVHTVTRPDDAADGGAAWTGRTGRIDADLLAEAADGLDDPVHYVCGTPEMVEDMHALLRGMGVPDGDILYEEFWGY